MKFKKSISPNNIWLFLKRRLIKKEGNGRTLVIFLLLFFLIVLGVAGWLFSKKMNKGWILYTNEKDGYEISYPQKDLVRLICPEEESTLMLIRADIASINGFDTSRGFIKMMSECGRDSRYTLEIVTHNTLFKEAPSSKLYTVTKEDIVIDGIKAEKYIVLRKGESRGPYSPEWFSQVLIHKDDKSYEIYLDEPALAAVFDQMLTTFRFID